MPKISLTLPALPPTRLPQERRIVTSVPGSQSQEYTQRRHEAITSAVSSVLPIWVIDVDGGIIVDADGNSFIDLGSGIAVTTVGGSNPAVIDAVTDAAQHFTHTCFMVNPYKSYLEVCEKLNSLTPGGFAKKTILVNSGAEAVENAIKIARYSTGRKAIIALEHAYHGRTNFTMGLTAKANPYKRGFGPFPSSIYRVPSSYPLRDGGLSGHQAASKVITLIENLVSPHDVAAIIAEPIQGEGGFIVPAAGFLPELLTWAHNHGVIFIADEIQTGLTRTGDWFASSGEGIEPDMVTIAKGIAAGLPLAAVTGRAEILDSVHPGGLGGTYGGNPLSCAAALATLDFMEKYNLNARAQEIEKIIRRVLEPLTAYSQVAQIRGRGAMIALEFTHKDSLEPNAELARTVTAQCHQQGVIVLTAGTYGNVIRLLPPVVIEPTLLTQGLTILKEAIEKNLT